MTFKNGAIFVFFLNGLARLGSKSFLYCRSTKNVFVINTEVLEYFFGPLPQTAQYKFNRLLLIVD